MNSDQDVEKICSRQTADQALPIDVREALTLMPEDVRAVATLFMDYSQAEVARRTGLSRQRVRGIRRRIAQHLCAAEFDR